MVRYADDFKIFCSNRKDAKRAYEATKAWLHDRLKLEVSEEKSKIVNLKKGYSEFLILYPHIPHLFHQLAVTDIIKEAFNINVHNKVQV